MSDDTMHLRLTTPAISPPKKADNAKNNNEMIMKTSPTRVLDFEDELDTAFPEDDFADEEMKLEGEDDSSPQAYRTPTSSGSIYRRSDDSRRQRHAAFRVLPTLDETSSGSSGDEADGVFSRAACQNLELPVLSESFLLSTDRLDGGDVLRRKCDKKQILTRPRSYFERVKEMEDKALQLAETGREDDSIDYFRKLLRRNAAEIGRIKDQMTQVEGKHARAVDSIHSRLREDWSKVSMSTGFVHMCLSNLYERLGNYKKAISSCREALDTYKRHAQLADAEIDGMSVQDLSKEAQKALDRLKNANSTFEERRERHEEIVALRNRMTTTGDSTLMSRLEEMTLYAKEVESNTLGNEHPQVADTCLFLSELAQEQDDHERALTLAKEALSINRAALGDPHPQTGNTLLHIARLYDARNENDAALNYYNQSLEVMLPLQASQGMIGSILNDAAIIHIRQFDFDKAIEKLKDALASYKSDELNRIPDQSQDTSVSCELVQVWRNLGECHFQKKEYTDASNSLVNALNLQRDIRRIHDAANQSQLGQVAADCPLPFFATDVSIAETLRRLGKSYRGQAKYKEAVAVLKEAILIHRLAVSRAMALSKKGISTEALPEKQDELASSMYCLAEVCVDANDLSAATKLFNDSLQLRMFSDANRGGGRTNMVHCAMCLVGLGSVHFKQGEFKQAHKVFGDALVYCDAHGVPEHNIIHKMIRDKIRQAELAQSEKIEADEHTQLERLEKEVDEQLKREDLDRAIGTLTRIMAIRRALLKLLKSSGRDSSKVRYDTACVLQKFGDALAKKGDKHHAEKAYADSLKLFKKAGVPGRCESVAEKLAMVRQHMA